MWIGRANAKLGLAASIWANPYKIGVHGDRRQVLDQFWVHLQGARLQGRLYELGGKTLVCSCRLDQACHGDIILKHWDDAMAGQKDILMNLKKAKLTDQRQPLPPEPARPAPPPKPPDSRPPTKGG